jgi:hypothetical protein
MTIAEVIQKATEGGYHSHGPNRMDIDDAGANSAYSAWTRSDNDATCSVSVHEALLDPQFWRALVVLGRNNPSPYTVNGRPLYVHLNGLAIVLLK